MAKKNKKRAFRNSKSNLAKRESNSTKRDKDVPTVSACMMVKDEEELLPQCLESIKGVVDEIIVVDTGSADRTVEIAKRYGAKVFHHPWENDFSKHRNQSISYATSDWIFIIDADEGLSPESSPKLKQTLLDIAPEVSYLYFEVADMDSQGQMMSAMNSPRLFRNHMGFKFKNFIHNELELKGHGERSNLILCSSGRPSYSKKEWKKSPIVRRHLFFCANLTAWKNEALRPYIMAS
jgi:glycosyltransferase involved in cell wall biosynthesis